MPIINQTKNTVLAQQALIAKSFYARAKGLLGRKQLGCQEALVITSCNSIHTFFMRFPIDAVFVDKNNRVVGLESAIKPWRLSRVYWKAKFVVELPEGTIIKSNTQIGDELIF